MELDTKSREELLLKEIEELREKLEESEAVIEAIQSGRIDAIVVHHPTEQVYTLKGADYSYRILIEAISEGTCVISREGMLTYCNSRFAEMCRTSPVELAGSSVFDSIGPDDLSAFKNMLTMGMKTSAKGECTLRTGDGILIPAKVSVSPLVMDDFQGACAVFTGLSEQKKVQEELRRHRTELERMVDDRTADLQQEIAERKRMEGEIRKSRDELELRVQERTAELKATNRALTDYTLKLERLNEELQDFAFVASHDLQEPLRKIQTFGKLIVDKYRDSFAEEGQDYLMRVTRAANRMSELLQSLLAYSRVATRPNPFDPTDLKEVIEDAVSDLEVIIANCGGSVEIGDLPSIDADRPQLRQLFQNLISNSMKYCRKNEKPVVRISGSIANGMCRIMLQDNGIGFDPQYVDRIFRPFQRLHGRNADYEGTGMGLAICRKIVERHGGSITATSVPGQGSTFIVSLPTKHGDSKGA